MKLYGARWAAHRSFVLGVASCRIGSHRAGMRCCNARTSFVLLDLLIFVGSGLAYFVHPVEYEAYGDCETGIVRRFFFLGLSLVQAVSSDLEHVIGGTSAGAVSGKRAGCL
jgi:hypothetical protein